MSEALFADVLVEVAPGGVDTVDQGDLFLPEPPFDLFFSGDCVPGIGGVVVVDQFVNVIFLGKSLDQLVPVFIYSPRKIVGYAYVENAVCSVGEDVYVVHGIFSFAGYSHSVNLREGLYYRFFAGAQNDREGGTWNETVSPIILVAF